MYATCQWVTAWGSGLFPVLLIIGDVAARSVIGLIFDVFMGTVWVVNVWLFARDNDDHWFRRTRKHVARHVRNTLSSWSPQAVTGSA